MPLLAREIDMYPETLLDEQADESARDETPWWAIYTLARREKELARRLWKMEIPFYLPTVKRQVRSPSGRKRESFVPLFPGYVFLHGSDDARQRAMTTQCVSRCLEVRDAEQLRHDLRQVRRLIDGDAPLTPESRLAPGMPVRVTAGPMQGLEGTVVHRRGRDWIVVAVRFLQQGVSLALEDYLVEPIG